MRQDFYLEISYRDITKKELCYIFKVLEEIISFFEKEVALYQGLGDELYYYYY